MSEAFDAGCGSAVIKVVGVGGAGLNAVNAMIDAQIEGVDYMAVNLSLAGLRKSKARIRVHIGDDPRGFITGGDPAVARQAVERHSQTIAAHLRGSDMVFVAAGLGGGTGTGAAPAVARIARETGALVVAVVTMPFTLEGRKMMVKAEEGLCELRRHADSLIIISNDRLVDMSGNGVSLVDAFRPADDVLLQSVQAIAELVNSHGHINADFNDVRTVMTGRGTAMIGMGTARGENRASEAVASAISSPLLKETDIQGARGILLNITASSSLTMEEFDIITKNIHEMGDEDANIIIGMVIDEGMKDELKVTVIATGLRD